MPKEKSFDEKTVLQNATELFWNKGYNGTSMDELTKATGLSRSSIYNTFEDKHHLFMKCIRFYQDQQIEELQKLIQKASTSSEKIEIIFNNAINDIVKDESRKGCMAVNTTTELANQDEEVSGWLCKNMEDMETQFATWVTEAQQSGEINSSFSAQALGKYLYSAFCGLRVIGQTTRDRKSLEEIVAVALSVLK